MTGEYRPWEPAVAPAGEPVYAVHVYFASGNIEAQLFRGARGAEQARADFERAAASFKVCDVSLKRNDGRGFRTVARRKTCR